MEAVVSQHPIFKRQDTSIFSTVPISFAKAALGGAIRIKTVDGEVEYEVKPGTQTDTKVRLKGKGVPSLRNRNVRGDHYVTLVVQVPTSLNAEAREALRRFDEVSGQTLRSQSGPGPSSRPTISSGPASRRPGPRPSNRTGAAGMQADISSGPAPTGMPLGQPPGRPCRRLPCPSGIMTIPGPIRTTPTTAAGKRTGG